MTPDIPSNSDQQALPRRPDLRQSLSHTLLASAFVLVGILNPFASDGAEAEFHWWMMVVLAVTVVLSWYFVIRRWLGWRSLPIKIKVVQAQIARYDRDRARSHALMSALALLLTMFAFLSRAVEPDTGRSSVDNILFYIACTVTVLSAGTLSGSIRDILAQHRQTRAE